MDPINVASIVVAIITSAAAWASQRSASKAATSNSTETSRVDMEKEAYERARSYDTETIRRQDAEIDELRLEKEALRDDKKNLYVEIRGLRERILRLETDIQFHLEEILNERLRDPSSRTRASDNPHDEQQGLRQVEMGRSDSPSVG